MLDLTKPLRFAKVQSDNHVTYIPKVVGTYQNPGGERRIVVVLRNWDHALSFVIYDAMGKPLDAAAAKSATNATGVFDPTLVNGDPIEDVHTTLNGVDIVVTFDGSTPVSVRKF